MSDIRFLTAEEVLEIHLDQTRRYGGAPDVRDMELLRSALAMPEASFADQYLHEDICAMAAAYMFHIAQNHPFVDGNKRTGAVAALVFLELNGVQVEASEDQFEQLAWSVAKGESGKEDIAAFFRSHSAGSA